MRECKVCGRTLPLDEFPRSGHAREGRRWQCKACWNRRSRIGGWRGPSARLPSHVSRSIGL